MRLSGAAVLKVKRRATARGSHVVPALTMALRIVSSLWTQAVATDLNARPRAVRRSANARIVGLHRIAVTAHMYSAQRTCGRPPRHDRVPRDSPESRLTGATRPAGRPRGGGGTGRSPRPRPVAGRAGGGTRRARARRRRRWRPRASGPRAGRRRRVGSATGPFHGRLVNPAGRHPAPDRAE